MAEIVAVCRFCEAGSKMFTGYVSYIDREKATRQSQQNRFNIFSHYMDYMDNDAKTVADQSQTLEKVSALFTKDLDVLSGVAKKEVRKVFRLAQDNGSNMWQTVISFDNVYLQRQGLYDEKTGVLNEAQLRQAARKAVGRMLQREQMDNAVWTGAFHYNTDNIHIHIAIVEPEPMRQQRVYTKYVRNKDGEYLRDSEGNKVPMRDAAGQIITRKAYKGFIKKSSIEALKSVLRAEIEQNREAYRSITKLLREDILGGLKTKTLLDIPEFTDRMLDLHKALVSSHVPRRYWNYNQHRLAEVRSAIDALSDLYLQTFHADDYQRFLLEIEMEAERQTGTYGGTDNPYVENMLYGKEGLYARLGNTILRQIASYDKELKTQVEETRKASNMLKQNTNDYAPEKGIAMLRELAKHGNAFAQNELGLIYLKGEHVEKDIRLAEQYFRRSAEQGNEFGEKMLQKLRGRKGQVLSELRNNYNARCRGQMRKGFYLLERNLKQTYLQYRNIQEAERLQQEIAMRGEEYDT